MVIFVQVFHVQFFKGGCWCLQRFCPTPSSATRAARRRKRTASMSSPGSHTSSLRYATGNLSLDINIPWFPTALEQLPFGFSKPPTILFCRKFYGKKVKEFVQGPGETIYMPVCTDQNSIFIKNPFSGTPGPCCDEYWRKPFGHRKPFPARQSRGLGSWVRSHWKICSKPSSKPGWWQERILSALKTAVQELGTRKGFGSQCTSGEN